MFLQLFGVCQKYGLLLSDEIGLHELHEHISTWIPLFCCSFICAIMQASNAPFNFFLKYFLARLSTSHFLCRRSLKNAADLSCCAPNVLYCACGKQTAIGLSWFPSKHVSWNDWGIKIFYISILFLFFCQEKRIIVATESTVWLVSACFCSTVAVSTKLVCSQNALYWKASWVSTLLS